MQIGLDGLAGMCRMGILGWMGKQGWAECADWDGLDSWAVHNGLVGRAVLKWNVQNVLSELIRMGRLGWLG